MSHKEILPANLSKAKTGIFSNIISQINKPNVKASDDSSILLSKHLSGDILD